MFYDLAKTAVNRLAFAQGQELAPHGGAAVALTPGFVRSEMMLEAFGVTEAAWRDAPPDGEPITPPSSRSLGRPVYVGRAVAALAGTRRSHAGTSASVTAGGLARGVRLHSTMDGTQPDWGRWWDGVVIARVDAAGADAARYRWIRESMARTRPAASSCMDPPLSTMYVSAWRSACAPPSLPGARGRASARRRSRSRPRHPPSPRLAA